MILVRKETVAGRYPRHGSRQGHSHLARRHDQPRGGGLPRHGHALRGRRRSHSRSTSTRSRSPSPSGGKTIDAEGRRLAVARRLHRRSLRRQGQHHRSRSRHRAFWRPSWSGPTSSAATSACAPMPTSRATPRWPASSAPKASACAAPSTCSSPKTASSTCRP